ncbi:acyl-CoA dehydrogenase [Mycena sp. CBHHK59/15]|nr:acyl-CoA dehydrogenase [Mycena sp. CBHHK59/15]
MANRKFSKSTVSQHNNPTDLWVVIDSKVFDLSSFASVHPGGLAVLLDPEIAGQDATESFYALHRSEVLDRYPRLQIGVLEDGEQEIEHRALGSLSSVPYAEPTWLSQGYKSPYYKDHHRRFQAAFRKFVNEAVFPDAQARELDGGRPSQAVFDEMARLNILAMRVGQGKHLEGRVLMDGIISIEEFDVFHELIINQELARLHARGYNDGIGGGTIIGLPPVINFGEPPLRDRVVEDALSGKKPICLAVTEAFAGSDVQGIRCRAKQIEGGWIVNGSKKWITNGAWAHYFTVACKTDNGEIIILVVERGEGVVTKLIKTSYSTAAGTAFVTFTNVQVPVGNRLGTGQPGLNIILANFNHERWVMTCASIASQRLILEECFKWVSQRKVFGKPLSSQAVVRAKLAAMTSRVESCQNWLEGITFQMARMNVKQQARYLAGSGLSLQMPANSEPFTSHIAFLKMHASRTAQETAADAVQVGVFSFT